MKKLTIEEIRQNYKKANQTFDFYVLIEKNEEKKKEAVKEVQKWRDELLKVDENFRKIYCGF